MTQIILYILIEALVILFIFAGWFYFLLHAMVRTEDPRARGHHLMFFFIGNWIYVFWYYWTVYRHLAPQLKKINP